MATQFLLTGFIANLFSTNTFILSDVVRKTAIIFDAPGNTGKIADYLRSAGIERVEALFLTHGHVDHIMAVNEYRKQLPGDFKIYLGEKDINLWKGINQQISDFGVPYQCPPLPDPDVLMKGGEVFEFGDTTIHCIACPGHSEGSIVYYVERKGAESLMITGDVLFANSVGRTDWTGIPILEGTSSSAVLRESINKLREYPPETPILAGHNDCSTLGKALKAVQWMLYLVFPNKQIIMHTNRTEDLPCPPRWALRSSLPLSSFFQPLLPLSAFFPVQP